MDLGTLAAWGTTVYYTEVTILVGLALIKQPPFCWNTAPVGTAGVQYGCLAICAGFHALATKALAGRDEIFRGAADTFGTVSINLGG